MTDLNKTEQEPRSGLSDLTVGLCPAEIVERVAIAYGYLWHVNNETGTPCQYPPERAAYEARKILRDMMTHEQRGDAINKVRELIGHNDKLRGE
ncbi:MAG: hypothetical protein WC236_15500 [Gallionellaceae bacterium]|jgi:hypothetical protein